MQSAVHSSSWAPARKWFMVFKISMLDVEKYCLLANEQMFPVYGSAAFWRLDGLRKRQLYSLVVNSYCISQKSACTSREHAHTMIHDTHDQTTAFDPCRAILEVEVHVHRPRTRFLLCIHAAFVVHPCRENPGKKKKVCEKRVKDGLIPYEGLVLA